MKANPINVERMHQLFVYDSDTGVLTNRVTRGRYKAGRKAGRGRGRLQTVVDGKTYQLARIAWAMHNNADPGELVIDHINGDPLDNRAANLRACTQKQNTGNRRGSKGVYKRSNSRGWYSMIRDQEGKLKNLGSFDCPLLARMAWVDASREIRGEYTAV